MNVFVPCEQQRQYWITTLSNFLYDHFNEGRVLTCGLQRGCRCGSCHEFQIVDGETREVVASAAALEDFLSRPEGGARRSEAQHDASVSTTEAHPSDDGKEDSK